MAELGQIERPEAESFTGKRKLYCVPNVYPVKDAPEDYRGLVDRYWKEVAEHIERLEVSGKVRKIFCESISVKGDEAFEVLASINEQALQIIRKKVQEGAELLPIESDEIFGPYLDWANCLNVVRTKEVIKQVFGFYTELLNKRIEHARGLIEANLPDGEAGLLIMRDEDRVRLQFPEDVEVFLVTPPSYDDILRWFRDKMKELQKEAGPGEGQ
jgi:hypothetical protein